MSTIDSGHYEALHGQAEDPYSGQRHDHKVERSQAERDLQLARGVADKAGISRKPKASLLNSFLMQSYTAKELDSAKDSARKDLQQEKEQDRTRGDDGGRTMKP